MFNASYEYLLYLYFSKLDDLIRIINYRVSSVKSRVEAMNIRLLIMRVTYTNEIEHMLGD